LLRLAGGCDTVGKMILDKACVTGQIKKLQFKEWFVSKLNERPNEEVERQWMQRVWWTCDLP